MKTHTHTNVISLGRVKMGCFHIEVACFIEMPLAGSLVALKEF